MKTNRFENTIRRKLESIEPDFQEQDWARMQNYMQAHTPPSFLQQYGSWIGYAAAGPRPPGDTTSDGADRRSVRPA